MSADNNPVSLTSDQRINELERRLVATQAALDRHAEQIAQILARQSAPPDGQTNRTESNARSAPEPIPSFVSRRSMLKNAALATLGAATVMEIMPSAKASNSSYLKLGTDNTASGYTLLSASLQPGISVLSVSNSGPGDGLFGYADQGGSGVVGTSRSGAGVAGYSTSGIGVTGSCYSDASGSGVSGYCQGLGTGVTGNATSGSGVYGVSTSGPGVKAVSNSGNGLTATTASSSTIAAAAAAVSGISSTLSSYGVGVYGQCDRGTGIFGQSADYYGAFLRGGLAPVLLAASNINDPNKDTQTHAAGELFVDVNKGLWYNTTFGTPGVWRKVADANTAGALSLLPAPTRFIDTRTLAESATSTGAVAPQPNIVATYAFTGGDAMTPYTPQGTTAPVIPYGATALVGRITVVAGKNGHTAAGGNLKVSNVSPPGFGSGLLTWGAGPSTQNAPFVLTLNNGTSDEQGKSGVLYFLNASSDQIDVIVDVTGYYY